MDPRAILAANQANYEALYAKNEAFLRYPADWLIRFYNMALRSVPPGRALDYGCGSGNNSMFLMQKGWEAYGVDAAPSFPKLLMQNLALHHLPESTAARFSVISPNTRPVTSKISRRVTSSFHARTCLVGTRKARRCPPRRRRTP